VTDSLSVNFSELSEFMAIPRVESVVLSPDGGWLAATIANLSADKTKYVNSIWRIDLDGAVPVRLTRSAEGESAQAFLPDGSLLFVSTRPDPAEAKRDRQQPDGVGEKPALWALPPGGGEAYPLTAPPGGVAAVVAARNSARYVLTAKAFPGTSGRAEDAERRKARAEAGVNAILHMGDGDRIRFWDSDIGPDELRLLTGTAAGGTDEVTDLTPAVGRALDEQAFCLSPDGATVVTGWLVPIGRGGSRSELVAIDVATGERRVLMTADDQDFGRPVISPDGQQVVAARDEHDTYERHGDSTLMLAPLAGDDKPSDLLAGFDRLPKQAVWSEDSATVYFTADDLGRCQIFAVDVGSGAISQLTTDDAAYGNLCPAPDGTSLYALRAAIGEPPTPVRIDLGSAGPGGRPLGTPRGAGLESPVRLEAPGCSLPVPGQVREVSTVVADGTTIRGWLVLPDGASAQQKAPLLLWVHGGPYSSWNSWAWRWNPWLMAARGYAVLLPDPAMSTGYGHGLIQRGHGCWGDITFSDVMAITDVVAALPEIDETKTAMMGGSFGGYMANWIAGHTDRFAAIVSHAGLWALDQMFETTDGPFYWRREFGHPETQPERYKQNSPHLHAAAISTPVLIIHGDKDYRVPVGEALRMYSDLVGRDKEVRFLYFPDENHWILKPGDAVVWYETVLAFLAEKVLGQEWQRPELL
jgi:dipeptidyl aminopeptidase/acylaminoacyl peptidase